jgi:hypothetical protein
MKNKLISLFIVLSAINISPTHAMLARGTQLLQKKVPATLGGKPLLGPKWYKDDMQATVGDAATSATIGAGIGTSSGANITPSSIHQNFGDAVTQDEIQRDIAKSKQEFQDYSDESEFFYPQYKKTSNRGWISELWNRLTGNK